MMPMYARGYVTYGTVVATLIATLGDSAFVLIGAAVTDSSSSASAAGAAARSGNRVSCTGVELQQAGPARSKSDCSMDCRPASRAAVGVDIADLD